MLLHATKKYLIILFQLAAIQSLTKDTHVRASDRCAEALIKIEKNKKTKYDIVIMVQGDEPMIHSNMISEAVMPLIQDSKIKVSNLLGKITTLKELEDKNCIKVVYDKNFDALYFSREKIPTGSDIDKFSFGKQICIIPFKRFFY